MARRLAAVLATVVASSFLLGCFVFDELDKAEKLMDETTGGRAARKRNEEKAAAATASSQKPAKGAEEGILERARELWDKATAPAPVPPDPDNILVRCQLPNGARFTRKFDCLSQGGEILHRGT